MSKEQERAELHRVIWQIANDLRGSVDGWDFKSYVLGILFYRYIKQILFRMACILIYVCCISSRACIPLDYSILI